MKPRIQQNVSFFPIQDGVKVKMNEKEVVLKGKKVYSCIKILEPYLTGNYTLEQLVGHLPLAHQSFIENLLLELISLNIVVDASDVGELQIDAHTALLYPFTYELLQQQTKNPEIKFHQFRIQSVCLAGNGISHHSCAQAMLKLGFGSLILSTKFRNNLFHLIDDHEDRDPQFQCVWLDEEEFPVEGQLSILKPDLMIWVGDDYNDQDLVSYRMYHERTQCPLLIATTINGQGIVGPIMDHSAQATWDCLTDYLDHDTNKIDTFSKAQKKLIGNYAATEALKYLCECRRTHVYDQAITISPNSLKINTMSILPSPRKRFQEKILSEPEEIFKSVQIRSTREQFLNSVKEKFSCEHFGICKEEELNSLTQLPLRHAVVSVRFPNFTNQKPQKMIGYGLEWEEALEMAYSRALLSYAQVSYEALEPVAMRSSDMLWAQGRTYSEWLGKGILNAFKHWLDSQNSVMRLQKVQINREVSSLSKIYLNILNKHYDLPIEVYLRTSCCKGVYMVYLYSNSNLVGESVGRTFEEALLQGLAQILSHLQRDKKRVVSKKKREVEDSIYYPTDEILPPWSLWTPVTTEGLKKQGFEIVPMPWVHDLKLLKLNFLTGGVGVFQRKGGNY